MVPVLVSPELTKEDPRLEDYLGGRSKMVPHTCLTVGPGFWVGCLISSLLGLLSSSRLDKFPYSRISRQYSKREMVEEAARSWLQSLYSFTSAVFCCPSK